MKKVALLSEFYLAKPYNPLIMILCFWAFWPGLMFVVAAVFESRKVYLGKGQSRMFFPGDFMLGIGVVMLIGINAKYNVDWAFFHNKYYWIITAIVHLAIAIAIRTPDIARYPKGSRNSPTKIAHDFCGYFVCFWLLASIGLPQLFWAFCAGGFAVCAKEWIVFAFAAAFFIAMTIWDVTHMPTRETLLLMHPDKYQPIWKK